MQISFSVNHGLDHVTRSQFGLVKQINNIYSDFDKTIKICERQDSNADYLTSCTSTPTTKIQTFFCYCFIFIRFYAFFPRVTCPKWQKSKVSLLIQLAEQIRDTLSLIRSILFRARGVFKVLDLWFKFIPQTLWKSSGYLVWYYSHIWKTNSTANFFRI